MCNAINGLAIVSYVVLYKEKDVDEHPVILSVVIVSPQKCYTVELPPTVTEMRISCSQ